MTNDHATTWGRKDSTNEKNKATAMQDADETKSHLMKKYSPVQLLLTFTEYATVRMRMSVTARHRRMNPTDVDLNAFLRCTAIEIRFIAVLITIRTGAK
jgi:hypothetical protein